MSGTKRKCLTLEERVKCVKLLESGKSSRVVAMELGVGRTQVQNVLKRKREILDEYESNGNRDCKLFLDNAPVHPDITLKNVKLQFFPANTTSILQPMDAGIIQTTKLKYRKRQLQHVLVTMEKNSTKLGPEILREITILQAIYWISAAWKEVDSDTIVKCFAKCGFTPECVSVSEDDEDSDIEDDTPIAVLHLALDLFDCNFRELVAIDREFATCDNNMMQWDQSAVDIIKEITTEKENASESEDDIEEPNPSVVTVNEVSECLSKLRQFALMKNQSPMLDMVMNFEDRFVKMRVEATEVQSKISDFFRVK